MSDSIEELDKKIQAARQEYEKWAARYGELVAERANKLEELSSQTFVEPPSVPLRPR